MKKSKIISVVLPAYNEEDNIKDTIKKCDDALLNIAKDYEIIIIDDGSTDNTADVSLNLMNEFPKIKFYENFINLNVGLSIWKGLKLATGDYIIHNGADYPFDMNELEYVLPMLEEYDIVAMVRKRKSAHSLWRKITSFVNYWLIRILFWIPFKDMNFVQIYKKEVIDTVKLKAKSPSFVTPELLMRARDHGFKIGEYHSEFLHRKSGTPNFGQIRDILWSLSDMLAFRIERFLNI